MRSRKSGKICNQLHDFWCAYSHDTSSSLINAPYMALRPPCVWLPTNLVSLESHRSRVRPDPPSSQSLIYAAVEARKGGEKPKSWLLPASNHPSVIYGKVFLQCKLELRQGQPRRCRLLDCHATFRLRQSAIGSLTLGVNLPKRHSASRQSFQIGFRVY